MRHMPIVALPLLSLLSPRILLPLLLTLSLLFPSGARAVDFSIKGNFYTGVGAVSTPFVSSVNGKSRNTDDKFGALQRYRLFLDAVASESLSGSLMVQLGNTRWGHALRGLWQCGVRQGNRRADCLMALHRSGGADRILGPPV